ncbi:hypothetical protein TrCOL_g2292 [Triparma columacea]|uniref:Uncharacterized protein n=1 Tax=Triparma columacea TaxID=722753 RepID=A0A9W7G1D9_9STRA|nr:hypothetical protein TrCOL_g2292 [Triparma columacea]
MVFILCLLFVHCVQGFTGGSLSTISRRGISFTTSPILTTNILHASKNPTPNPTSNNGNDLRLRIARAFEESRIESNTLISLFLGSTVILLATDLDFVSTAQNILGTALPDSSADVVALAFGEGLAGLASASLLFIGKLFARGRTKGDTSESLAEAQFFVSASALSPLVASFGASSILAVLAASIPSELTKQYTKTRQTEEDEYMQMLLAQDKKKKWWKRPSESSSLDYVEFTTDVTKWLEYSVLTSNFRGTIAAGIGGGYYRSWLGRFVESAIFGIICAVSSELYKDTAYYYAGFGDSKKSDEVRSRTLKEWTSRYLFTSLASASLFGIYDAARLPLSSYVVELFSGGIDSCIGSSDFDLCTTVFLLDNDVELGASFQGEIRAVAASVYGLVTRSGIYLEDKEDLVALGRGLIVKIYSVAAGLI